MAVQAAPPSLPPFLYVDYSFQPYLSGDSTFDWNRTLTLVAGPQYEALDIGAPGQNFSVVPQGLFDWKFTMNGGPLGFILLTYLRGNVNPVGQYTWQNIPTAPYGPPPANITLSTTSPIQITTASPLPDAASATAYSQFIVTSGAVSTPAFTIVAGALPGGLNLNGASGEISGSATALGVFNFTIRATDAAGFVDKAFQLTVNLGLTITTASPIPKGIVGQPYSRFVAASNNVGAVTWTYHLSAGPSGTALNPGTGEIAGTPTFAAVFSFTIRATDSLGFVDKNFSLEMLAAIPAQVNVIVGSLTVPTGFTCLFGGGVTLDGTTMVVAPYSAILTQMSPTHYDDGIGGVTMDLIAGLWAVTSLGGIYNTPPFGVSPYAPYFVDLQTSVNCASANMGIFDTVDNTGIANLLGFRNMIQLVSYTDVSLPTPLQTDNYASGTIDVQAI